MTENELMNIEADYAGVENVGAMDVRSLIAEIRRLQAEPRWLPDMGVRIGCGLVELITEGNTIRIDNGDTANGFELPEGYALCVLVDPNDPYLRKDSVQP